ncbi:MAG: hypothetical protein HC782_01810 [Gammaproteobacteria bacterium]|nr:hypothetical protein [Gammaproteobacteria bacterium]
MLDVFFQEMRRELALTKPDFMRWLVVLGSTDAAAPAFGEAIEGYSAQLLRIGQTAEMLGMSGLGAWSTHANAALEAMTSASNETRIAATAHFDKMAVFGRSLL